MPASLKENPGNYLFVSDLDGTLLEPGGVLPGESVARLNRLIDAGLNFSIATARTYDAAHPVLNGVRFNLPVILFNGVFLTEFHTGHNLISTPFIRRDVVHGIMELLHPRTLDPFIYTFGETNRLLHRRAGNIGAQRYLNSLEGDRRLCAVQHYEFLDGEQIAGFLLIDIPGVLDPVYQELRTRFKGDLNLYFAEDIAFPGYYWLQVFHAEADKGRMLRRLAERTGFPLAKVVVFGDYLNDLEMFEAAGKAVAVANALPEVREAAGHVIAANAEQGVLKFLESVLDLKNPAGFR
ncbi:MAG: HAD family hydrolase [Nitrospinaceae bacterium]